MSFVHSAVQKESAEIDCSEFDFPLQEHDSVIKYIAVFVNKTFLEIVGLNIYLTMGKHSIAYTDLKNIEIAKKIEAITSLSRSVIYENRQKKATSSIVYLAYYIILLMLRLLCFLLPVGPCVQALCTAQVLYGQCVFVR